MNDDTLADASITATAWRELVVDPADPVVATLAEAARRHRVMVSLTLSPYESDVDDK